MTRTRSGSFILRPFAAKYIGNLLFKYRQSLDMFLQSNTGTEEEVKEAKHIVSECKYWESQLTPEQDLHEVARAMLDNPHGTDRTVQP